MEHGLYYYAAVASAATFAACSMAYILSAAELGDDDDE